jgi:glycine cleavage system H protein
MSDKHEIKGDRLYTRDHEWALWASDGVRVGIAAHAVDQLGDVTLVNIDVKAGDTVAAGKAFGTIESVKTLSDLFSPVSGKVIAVNGELENKPELVNEDCYESGWMIDVAPTNEKDKDALLSPSAYAEMIGTLAH